MLSPIRIASRAASTNAPRGLAAILQKNPEDVVITFAKRTAMGRAKKGQLKDAPVDEILHGLFKESLKATSLDPSKIDDICVGTQSRKRHLLLNINMS